MFATTCNECVTDIASVRARYTQASPGHADVPLVVRAVDRGQWNLVTQPMFNRRPKDVGVVELQHNARVLVQVRTPEVMVFRVVLVYAPDLDRSVRRPRGVAFPRKHQTIWARLLGFTTSTALAEMMRAGHRHATRWYLPFACVTDIPPSIPVSASASASASAASSSSSLVTAAADAEDADTSMEQQQADQVDELITGMNALDMDPKAMYCDVQQLPRHVCSRPAILHAMEQRAHLYEAVSRMRVAKTKTDYDLARQDALVIVVKSTHTPENASVDWLGFLAWRWLCTHSEVGRCMKPVFEDCENLIAQLRMRRYIESARQSRHDSRELMILRVLQRQFTKHGGCDLLCTNASTHQVIFGSSSSAATGEDADAKTHAPFQPPDIPEVCKQAWSEPMMPGYMYRVPFESPIALCYMKGPRLIKRGFGAKQTLKPHDDPCQRIHEDPRVLESRQFQEYASYVLYRGDMYIPDFAKIEHAMIRSAYCPDHRIVWARNITPNLKDTIETSFRQLERWHSCPTMLSRVAFGIDADQRDDLKRPKLVPASASLKDLYRILPPCMLPARPSLDPRHESHHSTTLTPLRGYDFKGPGRTDIAQVQLVPRANKPRWLSYRALARFTHLHPRQISEWFGHGTVKDVLQAKSASGPRYRSSAITCQSMQCADMCPYMRRSEEFKLDPQQRCMHDIHTLPRPLFPGTTVATSATSSSSSSSSVPMATDASAVSGDDHDVRMEPPAVRNPEHAITEALVRLGLRPASP